jgi:hypothetical protein
MPEAAISGRQAVPQFSGDPSAYSVKRMGDELSVLPPTGSTVPGFVTALPRKGESASTRHVDANILDSESILDSENMLGNERDNLYSVPLRAMLQGAA